MYLFATGEPGPDGGPVSAYLSDSGTYLGPGNVGGPRRGGSATLR
jgi:hypothetical protein